MGSNEIKVVGIVFSGGPAPSANAVISAAAISFLESGRRVVGFFHGYTNLQDYDAQTNPLIQDKHYRFFELEDVRGIRNSRGIIIGTSRANPGKGIEAPADILDPEKTRQIERVRQGLVDLGIDALISIGGDDTLKTANFLYLYQKALPPEIPRFSVIHLPKTIDNDYRGIDFTFGFFTAVDVMAKEVQNLRADAKATSSWFIVETMGRKAGWLSYGVAIAGEAQWVFGREDIDDSLKVVHQDGSTSLDVLKLADRIVDVILTRETEDRHDGLIVLAEGLAEELSIERLQGVPRDAHGHISLGTMDLADLFCSAVSERYHARTGQKKRIKGVQLGYESRCAPPHAFDVMLGSQLGIGAYRALVEEELDGHMVSASGQLELHYVPFDKLIDSQTLRTEIRFIEIGSDFHRLARFLETRTDEDGWRIGRREEN